MSAVELLSQDFNDLMNREVHPILKHYGIEHWEPSLVLRNPAKPGEWWVVSNDDLDKLAELLTAEASRRKEEDEQGDPPMLAQRPTHTA